MVARNVTGSIEPSPSSKALKESMIRSSSSTLPCILSANRVNIWVKVMGLEASLTIIQLLIICPHSNDVINSQQVLFVDDAIFILIHHVEPSLEVTNLFLIEDRECTTVFWTSGSLLLLDLLLFWLWWWLFDLRWGCGFFLLFLLLLPM